MIKVKSQIGGILEKITAAECDFCQSRWGLKCEPINNIEILFYRFLRKFGYSRDHWSVDDWQNYFAQHSVIRTLCYECYEEIRY